MSTATLPQIWSYGHPLDMTESEFGLLRDSSDAATDFVELRRRFEIDGYLYMKGYLDRDQVLDARASLTDGLAAAGVLDGSYPRIDGVCKPGSGYVFKPELTNNNPRIQNLLYSGRLPDFYRQFRAKTSAITTSLGSAPSAPAKAPILTATSPTWAGARTNT